MATSFSAVLENSDDSAVPKRRKLMVMMSEPRKNRRSPIGVRVKMCGDPDCGEQGETCAPPFVA
ncbi:AAEL003806-PA [Aedes aegypti]|uniref:AAEL003806-PA n=1 Tax=Aedes aegypti TaxID=7159 RepID=Q17EH9_AEDAE|nr:AAEL003806-PA [Aedes aegypti]